MKRRTFLTSAAGAAVSFGLSGKLHAQMAHQRDISYEPNRPLDSVGLRIEDGVKILKANQKGNIHPVVREEILDNPNAVFIMYGGIQVDKDEKGAWKPVPDQMARFGRRASELIFRKGTEKNGCTFIKPNLVGGLSKERTVEYSHGGIVQPFFVTGFIDGLHDMGNSNVGIGARGALRHNQVVDSGFQSLLDEHKIPLIEAHVQFFKDYKKSELVWHKNPDGMVQRKFCTYKPVYEKGTTFINLAHAHTHKVGHTTLTLKNIQGVMPRGYGHICDAWTTMDMWRADLMKDFNKNYRSAIEESYIKHAQMNYQHWDVGDYYKSYKSSGGYDAFMKTFAAYQKAKGKEEREAALNKCLDVADSRLFWAEIWAQRMMDIVEVLPPATINMVEGTFARGASGIAHADFLTIGKSSTAVDAVTSWLMGQDPRQIPYLRIAKERGLGENDIEKIPVYLLSEKGIERVSDYRSLRREKLGIEYYNGVDNYPPVFFG